MSYFEDGKCDNCQKKTTTLSTLPGYAFCSTECLKEFATEYAHSTWLQLVTARELLTEHIADYPQGDGFTVEVYRRILFEVSQALRMSQHTDGSDFGDIGDL